MAGHTPGPWSVPHFAEPETNCECGYVLTDHLMGAVCTVHASGEGDWKKTGDNPKFAEACANATLISAAPEMFEALEKARELIGAQNDRLSEAARESNINQAWHILDAALAKASGGQP